MRRMIFMLLISCSLFTSCVHDHNDTIINVGDHAIYCDGHEIGPETKYVSAGSSRVMCDTHNTSVVIVSGSSKVRCDGTRIIIEN